MNRKATLKLLDDAIAYAQRDVRDHKRDPKEVRQFLAGVVDGMKQARYLVALAK